MKKKCQIIMLSTENPSRLNLHANGKLDYTLIPVNDQYGRGVTSKHLYLISDEEIKESDYYIKDDAIFKCLEIINDARHGKVIVHHKDIKKCTNSFHFPSSCKKIIATTNLELKLYNSETLASASGFNLKTEDILIPQIPQSFIKTYIEKYNSGNRIQEIRVEYEKIKQEIRTGKFKTSINSSTIWETKNKINYSLKLSHDNTINISKLETKTYSRNEVEDILGHFTTDLHFYDGEYLEKWFNENYPE